MGAMRYKPLDKVRIKSLDWYNENKDKYGFVDFSTSVFVPEMSQFCGKIVTIEDVFEEEDDVVYCMEGIDYDWTDEMIEGLVEEEVSYDIDSEWLKHEISLPKGYIFKDENGNVINATKIVLEKKNKYPKTYKECCKVLNIAVRDLDILDNMLDTTEIIYSKNLDRLLNSFRKLRICRDAYWKIAGEEMGLGKPWEPGWSIYEHKFCLGTDKDKVIEECVTTGNRILAFPTAEMRDAFYENFKELIEFCKEFL